MRGCPIVKENPGRLLKFTTSSASAAKMCLKLENARHCLTFLSILGFLQLLLSVPIVTLSFIVFAQTTLGAALSPFWCGFVVSVEF